MNTRPMCTRSRLHAGMLAAALWLSGTGAASAATCTLTATPMAFPRYDAFLPVPTDAVSMLQVQCIPGAGESGSVGYTIRLADAASLRRLRNATHALTYELHADALRAQAWGDGAAYGPGVSASLTLATPLTPVLSTHFVYGRLPPGQLVPPGAYGSEVIVTVDY